MGAATGGTTEPPGQSRRAAERAGDVGLRRSVIVALGWGVYSMLAYVADTAGPGQFGHAFRPRLLTFVRVAVVVAVSSVIWVPVGVWIGLNPRVAQFMQPVVQVLASFPANFIFPFAIVVFLDIWLSLNYGSVLLMALGTQWYILFNVIAGASADPHRPARAMDKFLDVTAGSAGGG
jgi:NitT/TauT family transport system permease protein